MSDTLYLVTVKLPKNPEHNPHDKKIGPCPVDENYFCTDVTGEHHTVLARGEFELGIIQGTYDHITRIETVA